MKRRFKSLFTAVLAAAALTTWAWGAAPAFTDVAADADYAGAVTWAAEQGITNGTGDGTTFSAGEPCTRGEIAVFLYRAASLEEGS